MRVIEINAFGGPEVLELVDRPEPGVAEGQVRVRVQAAAVNPVDVWTRQGFTQALAPHQPPLVLGWDLAGVVETAGPGFEVGDRVAGMIQWFDEGRGAYADLVTVEPSWIAKVPDGVDTAQAGALPLNGLTAAQAFALTGAVAGQALLVTGASGAVGGYAVELAAAAGVHVIAVASYDDEAYVSGLGAKEVLGRTSTEELIAAVQARGLVDAVLDAAPIGPELIAATRDGGRFVAVTDPTEPKPERGITPTKVNVQPDGAQLADLLGRLGNGTLTVRVAQTVPLEDVAKVHAAEGKGPGRGKVVLTL